MTFASRTCLPGPRETALHTLLAAFTCHLLLTVDSEIKLLQGLAAARENRLDTAEKTLRVSMFERQIDPFLRREFAESAHNLGCVTNNMEERERLLMQSLAIRDKFEGFEKAITEECLANHFFLMKKFKQSESLYIKALATARLAAGKTRGYTLPYLSALINYYEHIGQADTAAALREEKQEIETEVISYFNRD